MKGKNLAMCELNVGTEDTRQNELPRIKIILTKATKYLVEFATMDFVTSGILLNTKLYMRKTRENLCMSNTFIRH